MAEAVPSVKINLQLFSSGRKRKSCQNLFSGEIIHLKAEAVPAMVPAMKQTKNPLAVALGKLARGKSKTMTDAAQEQRKNAAIASAIARSKRAKRNKRRKNSRKPDAQPI